MVLNPGVYGCIVCLLVLGTCFLHYDLMRRKFELKKRWVQTVIDVLGEEERQSMAAIDDVINLLTLDAS